MSEKHLVPLRHLAVVDEGENKHIIAITLGKIDHPFMLVSGSVLHVSMGRNQMALLETEADKRTEPCANVSAAPGKLSVVSGGSST